MSWVGTIRPYQADDLPFFRKMTLQAFYSGPHETVLPFDEAMQNPLYSAWMNGWGKREGDVCFIAEAAGGERLGAVYYRFFPFEDRSYGFVDPAIPEIGIAVVESARGTGVGTALLRTLMAHAKAAGLPRLSLSVDALNDARRLYERVGFREGGIIMIAELA